ncbi:MAG: hypothetical protein WC895_05135 [Candidatus Shapirobacteria bacterium]|jgi:hypothetical protein
MNGIGRLLSLSDIIFSAFREAFGKPAAKKPTRKRRKPKAITPKPKALPKVVEVETPIVELEVLEPVEVEVPKVSPRKINEKLLRQQVVRRRRKQTYHPPCQTPIPKPKLLLEFQSPVNAAEVELIVNAVYECPGRWLTADGVFERLVDPEHWYGSAQTYALAVARVAQILAVAIVEKKLVHRKSDHGRMEYYAPGTEVPTAEGNGPSQRGYEH